MREIAQRFLALHVPGDPLLVANPWDAGTARLFASLGFRALATTSSGFAATLGRADGDVTRDEVIDHIGRIAAATALPVSADLENGYRDAPADVAETVRLARGTGVAGCSIEDWSPEGRLYEKELAVERIAAAAEAAHAGDDGIVLTARAENYLRGVRDLDDTVARLRAYREAGADVLFAPGLRDPEDIARAVAEAGGPLNVLIWPGGPDVPGLAKLGVARISVGGALELVSYGAVAAAARELLGPGTLGFFAQAGPGKQAQLQAFREKS